MGNKQTSIAPLRARMNRVERKCNLILAEIRALRHSIAPSCREVDEVIESLHRTASVMRESSRQERRRLRRIAED